MEDARILAQALVLLAEAVGHAHVTEAVQVSLGQLCEQFQFDWDLVTPAAMRANVVSGSERNEVIN